MGQYAHHLQVIGEASRALSTGHMGRHPEVPWLKTISIRNVSINNSFVVDLAAVWSPVESGTRGALLARGGFSHEHS